MPPARPFLAWLLGVPALAAGIASGDSDAVCAADDASCRSKSIGGGYFWAHQKGDINRTGLSRYVGPKRLEAGPTWKWTDPNLDTIRMTPLIDDRLNIYLATNYGRIYKFSPDGQILWTFLTEWTIPTVPALMDGLLFTNTRSGYVIAVDMETGKERWKTRVSELVGSDTACLLALNGTIISAAEGDVTGGNRLVVALNADGTEKWTYRVEETAVYNFQASAPGDGTLIFQSQIGGVYRLDLETGKLLWFAGLPDRMPPRMTTGAAVVGPNGIVYCASNTESVGGVIHAYRLSDGSPVWRRDVQLPANQAVAVGRLAGSDDLAVVAGIGENPGFTAYFRFWGFQEVPRHWNLLRFVAWFPWVLFWYGVCCRRKQGRCCGVCLRWLLIFFLGFCWTVSCGLAVHVLALWTKEQPAWLWGTQPLPGHLLALSAETGETRWAYAPPTYTGLACKSDTEFLMPRLDVLLFDKKMDPICLPDNWAQAVIDADGTVYAGFQDGRLYAVRDEDGDGKIQAETEVSTYNVHAAFQASQGLAPGMLAAAPCGGGLYVWRY